MSSRHLARQLDLSQAVPVYRDTVPVNHGHRFAWMIVRSDPHPWRCGFHDQQALAGAPPDWPLRP